MRVQECEIPDVKLLTPQRKQDTRGWLSEVWRVDHLASVGIHCTFVQENTSWSASAFTIRGLHFQVAPMEQGKLVRVVRGAIFDVALDVRRGSPSYGRYVALRLSAGGGDLLWIPPGFAHGFCTLEPETEVMYLLTCLYSAEHERGFAWDDPDLAIPWPRGGAPNVSERDRSHEPFTAARRREAGPGSL